MQADEMPGVKRTRYASAGLPCIDGQKARVAERIHNPFRREE